MIGQLPVGTARSFPMQVRLEDGVTPSAAFLATDLLQCSVWAGDDQAVVASPSTVWLNAPLADYSIDFAAADSVLAPGTYRLRVVAIRGTTRAEILRDSIEVIPVAGTGVVIPSYCTYEDMATQCSWIGQYLDEAEDQAGFAEQRGLAREWMDGLILGAQPRGGGLNFISTQNYWTWSGGGGTGVIGSSLAVDQVMKGYLAAGGLVLTGPGGRKAVRACACYAIGLVFGAQPDNSMQKFAGLFMRKAQAEACTLVAEIDTNADGVSEYAISLGATNTRYG